MLRLGLVMCADDKARKAFEGSTNHRKAVFQGLKEAWTGTRRTVVAEWYFASVETAEQLMKTGLRFTGVIKTATKRFFIYETISCLCKGPFDIEDINTKHFKEVSLLSIFKHNRKWRTLLPRIQPSLTDK